MNQFSPMSERHVMAAFGVPKVSVVRVNQSPMNPKRWCLTLSCKHEMWVTATKRPARKTAYCHKCAP